MDQDPKVQEFICDLCKDKLRVISSMDDEADKVFFLTMCLPSLIFPPTGSAQTINKGKCEKGISSQFNILDTQLCHLRRAMRCSKLDPMCTARSWMPYHQRQCHHWAFPTSLDRRAIATSAWRDVPTLSSSVPRTGLLCRPTGRRAAGTNPTAATQRSQSRMCRCQGQ